MSRIVTVDEHDVVIGSAASALEAIKNGQFRRIVRVFLFNELGEMLIQKRSEFVRRPLQWDHAVGGHVDEGEDYAVAAIRETSEELGVTLEKLNIIELSLKEDDVFTGIFVGVISSNTQFTIDKKEVAELQWLSLDKLQSLIRDDGVNCTDGLTNIWPQFKRQILEGKDHKRITIVDEEDRVIGYKNYFDAIEKGCIRRASVVYVFDTEDNILVQRRSAHISKPLLLDKSVGGHVDEGETYHEAAVREMKEELGLVDFELTEIIQSFRSGNFFDTVYKTIIPKGTVLAIDSHEVAEAIWMTVQELETSMHDTPELYTEHFIDTWHQLRDKLLT